MATVSSDVSAHKASPPPQPKEAAFRPLEKLPFDNLSLRSLPVDPEPQNYIRPVRNACYSRVNPALLKNPVLVAVSPEAMTDLLDIDPKEFDRPDFAEYFSGNKGLPGSETYAHCYCGHQFGAFSGQLGDGAAMSLGEVVNHRGERWELQFKGSGPTPYSRRADGRKVLRSSIREFLCSEAMFHLQVPTTRAGTLVTSDTLVERDIFYNGNVIYEKASVVLRLAPTFLRFGSFEIFKSTDPMTMRAGPSVGNEELLYQMLDYVIPTYFPEIAKRYPASDQARDRYLAFYTDVVRSTAALVAKWQLVGFTHGVLNTDNMSILGLTIDYGPFGFMEWFDWDYVPNGSDHGGRYSYRKQPEICRWNLLKFSEALSPALSLEDSMPVLAQYDEVYRRTYREGMMAKLGLTQENPEDGDLINELFTTMESTASDFTDTFRMLSLYDGTNMDDVVSSMVNVSAPAPILYDALIKKLRICRPSMPAHQIQALWSMCQNEPERLAEMFSANIEAIKEELQGEMDKLQTANAVAERANRYRNMSAEVKREEDTKRWKGFMELYSARLAQESSKVPVAERKKLMEVANPNFILRNWIAQDAIEAAEKKDFSKVRVVLDLLRHPFTGVQAATCQVGQDHDVIEKYRSPAPEWAASLICTCSS